jgi:hypothetical protein
MMLETAILKNIENLPESVKQSVLLYTEFLANQYSEVNTREIIQPSTSHRLAGSMKGTFVLPLPDDFDTPLEDFEEYL